MNRVEKQYVVDHYLMDAFQNSSMDPLVSEVILLCTLQGKKHIVHLNQLNLSRTEKIVAKAEGYTAESNTAEGYTAESNTADIYTASATQDSGQAQKSADKKKIAVTLILERAFEGTLRNWAMRLTYNPSQFISRLSVLSQIGTQIEQTLTELHDMSIIHGDVKPENILLFENAQVAKLSDFGNSVRTSHIIAPDAHDMYTEYYRAPHLLAETKTRTNYFGWQTHCKCDNWALAISLLENVLLILVNHLDDDSFVTVFQVLNIDMPTTQYLKSLKRLESLAGELMGDTTHNTHKTAWRSDIILEMICILLHPSYHEEVKSRLFLLLDSQEEKALEQIMVQIARQILVYVHETRHLQQNTQTATLDTFETVFMDNKQKLTELDKYVHLLSVLVWSGSQPEHKYQGLLHCCLLGALHYLVKMFPEQAKNLSNKDWLHSLFAPFFLEQAHQDKSSSLLHNTTTPPNSPATSTATLPATSTATLPATSTATTSDKHMAHTELLISDPSAIDSVVKRIPISKTIRHKFTYAFIIFLYTYSGGYFTWFVYQKLGLHRIVQHSYQFIECLFEMAQHNLFM